MEDICKKFTQKVIEYIPLIRVSSTIETIYPVYSIVTNNNNNFLHNFLFQYFLYFANIIKIRRIYLPDSLSAQQWSELKGLAEEIERIFSEVEGMESINRELVNSHIMGIYGSRVLMRIKQIFKNY
jgi:hypothetical protein